MIKLFDKIIINAAFWLLIFVLTLYVSDYVALSVILSFIIFCIAKIIIGFIPRKDKNLLSRADRQRAYYMVNPSLERFAQVFKQNLNARVEGNFIILEKDNKKMAVYPLVSVLPVTAKEVIEVALQAKDICDVLYVITAEIEKSFTLVKPYLPVKTEELSFYTIFPALEKLFPVETQPVKRKFTLKFAHNSALLWGGFSMLLMSLIVPLKLYYIIVGVLSIGLYALSSIIPHKKSPLIGD